MPSLKRFVDWIPGFRSEKTAMAVDFEPTHTFDHRYKDPVVLQRFLEEKMKFKNDAKKQEFEIRSTNEYGLQVRLPRKLTPVSWILHQVFLQAQYRLIQNKDEIQQVKDAFKDAEREKRRGDEDDED